MQFIGGGSGSNLVLLAGHPLRWARTHKWGAGRLGDSATRQAAAQGPTEYIQLSNLRDALSQPTATDKREMDETAARDISVTSYILFTGLGRGSLLCPSIWWEVLGRMRRAPTSLARAAVSETRRQRRHQQSYTTMAAHHSRCWCLSVDIQHKMQLSPFSWVLYAYHKTHLLLLPCEHFSTRIMTAVQGWSWRGGLLLTVILQSSSMVLAQAFAENIPIGKHMLRTACLSQTTARREKAFLHAACQIKLPL